MDPVKPLTQRRVLSSSGTYSFRKRSVDRTTIASSLSCAMRTRTCATRSRTCSCVGAPTVLFSPGVLAHSGFVSVVLEPPQQLLLLLFELVRGEETLVAQAREVADQRRDALVFRALRAGRARGPPRRLVLFVFLVVRARPEPPRALREPPHGAPAVAHGGLGRALAQVLE